MEIRRHPDGLEMFLVTAPELDASFEIGGCAPVQGQGKVLDRELYFRARHDDWSFEIATQAGQFPSDGFKGPGTFYREGAYPNASWMPLTEAVKIILRCLADYTGVTIHIGALPFPKSPS